MAKWMITLTFKEKPTAEVLALLPAERAHIAEMKAQGVLNDIYIPVDGSRVWLVLNGDSQASIDEALKALPMRRFFNVDVRQLN